MALSINSGNLQGLLDSGQPLVIDFWAEWCGPCRMVAPLIEELAAEYAGRVTIGKCDVDENNDLAVRFAVRNIPTILFFKNGAVADKQVGAVPKATLVNKVNALL